MDECKYCTLRGDFDACQSADCNQHVSWMVNALHAKLNNSVHTIKISTIISKNNFAMSKDAKIILEDLRKLLAGDS